MKKNLLPIIVAMFLFSCGGRTTNEPEISNASVSEEVTQSNPETLSEEADAAFDSLNTRAEELNKKIDALINEI